MKILFKNTTEYNKKNYNEFLKFHQNKFGTKALIKICLISLCVLYIIITNLLNKNWKLIGIIFLIGIITFAIYKIRMKMQLNEKNKITKSKKKFTFFFYDTYIKVKCGRKFERIRYFELYKIFKTEEFFFLYTDEDHSLILSKKGFEIGTSESFEKFIQKKCPIKYKGTN